MRPVGIDRIEHVAGHDIPGMRLCEPHELTERPQSGFVQHMLKRGAAPSLSRDQGMA
jgi:hypothetical protein